MSHLTELKDQLKSIVQEISDALSKVGVPNRIWTRPVRSDGSTSFPQEVVPDFSKGLLRLRYE